MSGFQVPVFRVGQRVLHGHLLNPCDLCASPSVFMARHSGYSGKGVGRRGDQGKGGKSNSDFAQWRLASKCPGLKAAGLLLSLKGLGVVQILQLAMLADNLGL